MSIDPSHALFRFLGGRACLDFANTVDWRTSTAPQDLMPDYAALLRWSKLRGTLPAPALTRLGARGARRAAAAAAVAQEAHALRAEIWRAAEALHRGDRVHLGLFNRRLATLPEQPRLVRGGAGYVLDLPGRALEEPLWPVLWSLTGLLSSEDAARVRCCQAQGCGWFFVDASPNRSRTWCSNEGCGNRERARRAYARSRSRRDAAKPA
jgi:predicted RNA-binding Zn ribbon-like protein